MNAEMILVAEKDAVERYFLTEKQIEVIVKTVLKIFPIPEFIKDVFEMILIKIIKWIDKELYKLLPNEVYDLINHKEKGLNEEEYKVLFKRLVKMINEKVNLPFLNENQEKQLIKTILEIILKAMQIGKSLS